MPIPRASSSTAAKSASTNNPATSPVSANFVLVMKKQQRYDIAKSDAHVNDNKASKSRRGAKTSPLLRPINKTLSTKQT